MWLLGAFLDRFIKIGSLGVADARGRFHRFGKGCDGGPPDVVIALHRASLPWNLAIHPQLYLGEAYMDGSLSVTRGTLWDLLDLLGRNLALHRHKRRGWSARLLLRIGQSLTQANTRHRSRQNAAHHYDLSRALYASFLDADMQYSCAYFPTNTLSLDQAQEAKRKHIAAKLLLQPGCRVLDIGCGWGGLALDMARSYGVGVEAATLSHEQLIYAEDSAKSEHLDDQVHFFLKDYRELEGQYDRIVSVGMFEHVGTPFYGTFFRKVSQLLADDGVALIHTIGSSTGPSIGHPWIRKYIFPGGYIPSLSEILPAVEQNGLVVTDIEVLRLHYAETLKLWRERFMANWHHLHGHYDDRFRRMWEFYLAGSEMSFRHGGLVVFQLQLAKSQTAVPLTRDYQFDFERPQSSNHELRHERVA